MNLQELQQYVFREYKTNGYLEMFNKHDKVGDIAELGLICTEVSEAIEVIRKKESYPVSEYELKEELADIIIRVFNFANRKGINDLEQQIVNKTHKNTVRPKFHGKDV